MGRRRRRRGLCGARWLGPLRPRASSCVVVVRVSWCRRQLLTSLPCLKWEGSTRATTRCRVPVVTQQWGGLSSQRLPMGSRSRRTRSVFCEGRRTWRYPDEPIPCCERFVMAVWRRGLGTGRPPSLASNAWRGVLLVRSAPAAYFPTLLEVGTVDTSDNWVSGATCPTTARRVEFAAVSCEGRRTWRYREGPIPCPSAMGAASWPFVGGGWVENLPRALPPMLHVVPSSVLR